LIVVSSEARLDRGSQRDQAGNDHPSAETRSFVFFLTLFSVLFGQVIRLRIYFGVLLPPQKPVPWWFVLGALEDVLVFSLAASIVLGVSRIVRTERLPRIAFGAFAILLNVLQVVRSEVVIFLGAAIRPEDFRYGIPAAVVARSLASVAGLVLLITLMVLLSAVGFSWWLAGKLRERWLGPGGYFATFVGTAALAFFMNGIPGFPLVRNPLLSILAIQGEEIISGARNKSEISRPFLPELSVRELVPESPPRRYIDPRYPLAYATDDLPNGIGVKPNIVFFVVESLRAEEVGCYGADPPNVTPNIDTLAKNGIRIDPAYSVGTYTASGEVALWYGLAPLPREILLSSRPELTMTGLPEILRAAGWQRFIWIHNGDYNFYGRELFYPLRGVDLVDGRSFPPHDPRTNWGFSDRSLSQNAVRVLDRVQEPFVSMILTVTNHHPFDLPSDADPPMELPPRRASHYASFPGSENLLGNRTSGMIQTVHYSDEAIGDFIRLARSRPWFKNTIFVITGDHGSAIAPYDRHVSSLHVLVELRHRVPLIIFSPLLRGGRTVEGPATQADILPTLLAAAGVTLPRAGIGANLLDPRLSRDRIVVMWSSHGRILTLASGKWYYHAFYRGSGPFEDQEPIETLIDGESDPEGQVDLLAKQPLLVRRFRAVARVYFTVYPWLIVTDRSGVPPAALSRSLPTARAGAAGTSSTR
jgi:arylsulfatase A-like enzyme